jgi:hypothetical protein
MYQMRPDGESPALFKAKVPYLSGARKVNHAEPVLGYAFAACISP